MNRREDYYFLSSLLQLLVSQSGSEDGVGGEAESKGERALGLEPAQGLP